MCPAPMAVRPGMAAMAAAARGTEFPAYFNQMRLAWRPVTPSRR
jgi:hypothetical protein